MKNLITKITVVLAAVLCLAQQAKSEVPYDFDRLPYMEKVLTEMCEEEQLTYEDNLQIIEDDELETEDEVIELLFLEREEKLEELIRSKIVEQEEKAGNDFTDSDVEDIEDAVQLYMTDLRERENYGLTAK